MACRRPKKARLMLAALCAALCLTGCAGKPLAEREIVRAVFFAHEGGQYQAVLLLQDQQSEEAAAYRTSAGEGDTAAGLLRGAAAQPASSSAAHNAADRVVFLFRMGRPPSRVGAAFTIPQPRPQCKPGQFFGS